MTIGRNPSEIEKFTDKLFVDNEDYSRKNANLVLYKPAKVENNGHMIDQIAQKHNNFCLSKKINMIRQQRNINQNLLDQGLSIKKKKSSSKSPINDRYNEHSRDVASTLNSSQNKNQV